MSKRKPRGHLNIRNARILGDQDVLVTFSVTCTRHPWAKQEPSNEIERTTVFELTMNVLDGRSFEQLDGTELGLVDEEDLSRSVLWMRVANEFDNCLNACVTTSRKTHHLFVTTEAL